MISHRVRGDTVCSLVCISLCVCVDCLRTGTRKPNQRDTLCYIAEYKHPHYRVSLNVSDTERRMKGLTISEKNGKKNCSTGRKNMTSCSKKLFREHKATSVSATSPNRQQERETEREREVDFDTWVRVFTDIVYGRAYFTVESLLWLKQRMRACFYTLYKKCIASYSKLKEKKLQWRQTFFPYQCFGWSFWPQWVLRKTHIAEPLYNK